MANQYYFAVATLPMLSYGDDNGPDRTSFLTMCRESCTPRDFRLIESTTLQPEKKVPEKHEFLRKWFGWETSLRNAVVHARAKESGKDPTTDLREETSFYSEINDIVREAYNQASPLLSEDVLNRARWARFEELETGHHFDIEKLMVYHLKLQLNERKACFSKQAGEENFLHIYELIHETGNSRESVAGEY